ncbi:SHOCT domain-containing protein [Clostridium fungisolvens]|uniref:SHOCT domain-containing protein n=1 Tax=Clostridium fungisolvens TaxID=1604897 RepID=A0A6V8SHE4_9CLOT|nr:SHOCT domain-containing protein [Clostridium fungisolvens]GFP76629.1 hypothetical protein bsdtw1_02732 [Clostridium fungisolvens]
MFCNGFGGFRGYGGPSFFMMIPMLIIFLLVIYFVFKAVTSKNLNLTANKNSSNAMDILNERFAKGEINEEEYASKKKQLLK